MPMTAEVESKLEEAIAELRGIADGYQQRLEALPECSSQVPGSFGRALAGVWIIQAEFSTVAHKWGERLVSRMLPAIGRKGLQTRRRAEIIAAIGASPAFVTMCDDFVERGLLVRAADFV